MTVNLADVISERTSGREQRGGRDEGAKGWKRRKKRRAKVKER